MLIPTDFQLSGFFHTEAHTFPNSKTPLSIPGAKHADGVVCAAVSCAALLSPTDRSIRLSCHIWFYLIATGGKRIPHITAFSPTQTERKKKVPTLAVVLGDA